MQLQPDLQSPSNGEAENPRDQSPEEISRSCSTPFVSAPSSPGSGSVVPAAFFHSALEPPPSSSPPPSPSPTAISSDSFEFEFSARLSATIPAGAAGSMSSADELFLNGQIRPMKVEIKTPLQMPQASVTNEEDGIDDTSEVARGREQRMRPCKSPQRRTRSMSPGFKIEHLKQSNSLKSGTTRADEEGQEASAPTLSPSSSMSMDSTPPPMSTSSSRSSSAGRSSSRWVFLKDFLYRSKSEGRRSISGGGAGKYFWPSMTPSPAKAWKKEAAEASGNGKRNAKKAASVKMGHAGGGGGGKKRRVPAPSAHEMLYTANRAQAEELRKKTFLPYRQGLLGCLGFSSRSYGAINGFSRALNPVSSR